MMLFFLHFYRKLLLRILYRSSVYNTRFIDHSVKIKNSRVLGNAKIGCNSLVVESVLGGIPEIGENVKIFTSNLKGNIKIDSNSRLERLTLQGTLAAGKNIDVKDSQFFGQITLDDSVGIDQCILNGNISVGQHSALNGPMDIYAKLNPVSIGKYCSIARYVSIQEYNHPTDRCSNYLILKNIFHQTMEKDIISKGAIKIGHDVWIGAQTLILSGAIIGDGAVIGANSTVTGTIPPYAIAVGNPARVIKYRFPEKIISGLLQIAWWNWDDEVIRGRGDLFTGPLSFEKLQPYLNL